MDEVINEDSSEKTTSSQPQALPLRVEYQYGRLPAMLFFIFTPAKIERSAYSQENNTVLYVPQLLSKKTHQSHLAHSFCIYSEIHKFSVANPIQIMPVHAKKLETFNSEFGFSEEK